MKAEQHGGSFTSALGHERRQTVEPSRLPHFIKQKPGGSRTSLFDFRLREDEFGEPFEEKLVESVERGAIVLVVAEDEDGFRLDPAAQAQAVLRAVPRRGNDLVGGDAGEYRRENVLEGDGVFAVKFVGGSTVLPP